MAGPALGGTRASKCFPKFFSSRRFFGGDEGWGGIVVINKFASYAHNRKSRNLCYSPFAPHPRFQGRNVFWEFLFSVPWLTGSHFTCELISVTCLSGAIFPIFLVLCFGMLTLILERGR